MTLLTLPANLPDGADAQLPATYESAQRALAECARVDEAWTWQNKAAALAAYARMARDTALRDMACRIQARAQRRAGELLRMIPSGSAANLVQHRREGALPSVTRESAAREAGLSEHQRKTALRIASVPAAEFERAVESPEPPTVSELAVRGTVSRPQEPEFRAEQVGAAAARIQDLLRDFAAFCSTHDPRTVALACPDPDATRGYGKTAAEWLRQFFAELPKATF